MKLYESYLINTSNSHGKLTVINLSARKFASLNFQWLQEVKDLWHIWYIYQTGRASFHSSHGLFPFLLQPLSTLPAASFHSFQSDWLREITWQAVRGPGSKEADSASFHSSHNLIGLESGKRSGKRPNQPLSTKNAKFLTLDSISTSDDESDVLKLLQRPWHIAKVRNNC